MERRAEYMLDIIGAGATAVSDRDWHDVWLHSNGWKHFETRSRRSTGRDELAHPLVQLSRPNSPLHGLTKLAFCSRRQHLAYWRDPTYLMSKLSLNIIGGLLIGFTFFKTKNTLQGTRISSSCVPYP